VLEAVASQQEREDAEQLTELFKAQLKRRGVDRLLVRMLLRILIDPLSINRYIISRMNHRGQNISAAPYLAQYGGLNQLIYSEVSNLFRELTHMDRHRVAIYRSLVRAHNNFRTDRPS
jgi:hypothetical protein